MRTDDPKLMKPDELNKKTQPENSPIDPKLMTLEQLIEAMSPKNFPELEMDRMEALRTRAKEEARKLNDSDDALNEIDKNFAEYVKHEARDAISKGSSERLEIAIEKKYTYVYTSTEYYEANHNSPQGDDGLRYTQHVSEFNAISDADRIHFLYLALKKNQAEIAEHLFEVLKKYPARSFDEVFTNYHHIFIKRFRNNCLDNINKDTDAKTADFLFRIAIDELFSNLRLELAESLRQFEVKAMQIDTQFKLLEISVEDRDKIINGFVERFKIEVGKKCAEGISKLDISKFKSVEEMIRKATFLPEDKRTGLLKYLDDVRKPFVDNVVEDQKTAIHDRKFRKAKKIKSNESLTRFSPEEIKATKPDFVFCERTRQKVVLLDHKQKIREAETSYKKNTSNENHLALIKAKLEYQQALYEIRKENGKEYKGLSFLQFANNSSVSAKLAETKELLDQVKQLQENPDAHQPVSPGKAAQNGELGKIYKEFEQLEKKMCPEQAARTPSIE